MVKLIFKKLKGELEVIVFVTSYNEIYSKHFGD